MYMQIVVSQTPEGLAKFEVDFHNNPCCSPNVSHAWNAYSVDVNGLGRLSTLHGGTLYKYTCA